MCRSKVKYCKRRIIFQMPRLELMITKDILKHSGKLTMYWSVKRNQNLILIYSTEIRGRCTTRQKKNRHSYQSVRLRKAYWNYLKEYPNNDQIEDYFFTCDFIDRAHRIYNKQRCTSEDFETYKELLSENRHIATPLDLFRFCIIRKKKSIN